MLAGNTMAELRKDPLTHRWVIVSTERTKSPTEFISSTTVSEPETGKTDPLAEGNEKMTPPEIYAFRPKPGPANSGGWKVRVIPNTYPVLRIEGQNRAEGVGIYDMMDGVGAHEIIVETPKSDQPLETLSLEEIADVFKTFKLRMIDLEHDMRFRYLLVFKNVGKVAGASLSHAHSQLIATPVVPKIVQDKLDKSQAYYHDKERSIFEDILQQELRDNHRIVYQNAGFVAFCPYASRFPFEISIYPRRQMCDFYAAEKNDFLQIADCYKVVIQKLNKALNHPHYNCLLYTAPTRSSTAAARMDGLEKYFRWHLEIFPRVTMITGFEVGSGFYINPVPPEAAAQFMQDVQI